MEANRIPRGVPKRDRRYCKQCRQPVVYFMRPKGEAFQRVFFLPTCTQLWGDDYYCDKCYACLRQMRPLARELARMEGN